MGGKWKAMAKNTTCVYNSVKSKSEFKSSMLQTTSVMRIGLVLQRSPKNM